MISEIGSLYVEMNGENVFVVYINMPESPAVPFSTGEDEVI